jgi:hypothetical protein
MINPNIEQFHQTVSIRFVNFPLSLYQVQIIPNLQYFRTIVNSPNLSQHHESQISSIQNSPILTNNSFSLNLSNLVQDSSLPDTSDSIRNIQNPNIINSTQYFETANHPNLSQNQKLDNSFKLSFLESLTLEFPSIIRKFLSEFFLLPECSSEMRRSISIRTIKRSCVKDLLEIIRKYSPAFCSYLNENLCISLLSQTYHEHFFLVPNQKIPRIHKFIHILFEVSSCIGTNQQLMLLQNSITNLLSKF